MTIMTILKQRAEDVLPSVLAHSASHPHAHGTDWVCVVLIALIILVGLLPKFIVGLMRGGK